jgi:hypothetical protein
MSKPASAASLNTHVERIQSAYARAAARIIEILSALDPANFTAADHGRALREVQGAVEVLNVQVRSYTPEAIRAAYAASADVARTRLELIGAKPSRRYNASRPEKRIAALAKMALRDYAKANRTIEKTARQYLATMAYAQKKIESAVETGQIQEFSSEEVRAFINRMVAGSLRAATKYSAGLAHLTSKDIAAKIRARLIDRIEGGNFIKINGKNYDLKSYSELVARTRMRESQTDAVVEMCKEFENDLVFVPPHADPCEEICAEYQGKVFSISGNHPDYPMLPDGGPPWHPRCECNCNPTSENALARR